jgi:hypothetical protein
MPSLRLRCPEHPAEPLTTKFREWHTGLWKSVSVTRAVAMNASATTYGCRASLSRGCPARNWYKFTLRNMNLNGREPFSLYSSSRTRRLHVEWAPCVSRLFLKARLLLAPVPNF